MNSPLSQGYRERARQRRAAAEAQRRESWAAWRRDLGPADPAMYVATAIIVVMPLLAGINLLAVEPALLLTVFGLSCCGLPISLWLRRRGANQRLLNGVVTLVAMVAAAPVLRLAVAHGSLSTQALVTGESIYLAWLIRAIAWVVAFRSMTLLTDFDLLLCVGFSLSQFILLGILASDTLVLATLLPCVAASVFLLMRFRRRQLLMVAEQVVGRSEVADWRQDTALLLRLSVVVGLLSALLGLSLSGLQLHSTFIQTIGAPLAMRLARWIGQYQVSRLAEGTEPTMEVGDVGGPSSEVPVFKVSGRVSRLWRGTVYGEYDGRRFKPTGEKVLRGLPVLGDNLVQVDTAAPTSTTGLDRYTFERMAETGTLIYTVAGVSHVQVGNSRLIVNSTRTIAAIPAVAVGGGYTVWAPPVEAPPTTTALAPADRLRYLQLPDHTAPRVRSLARQITAGALTHQEKAEAIMKWLGDHKAYSLRPVPSPRNVDAVEFFLFNMESGWCRHFAAAFAVLARSVAVPTRVVGGYASGEQQADGSSLVRIKDAHAWAECWLPGRGWVEYDPTSMANEELTGLAKAMDVMRGQWHTVAARLNLRAVGGCAAGLAGLGLAGWWLRRRRRAALQTWAGRRRHGSDKRAERLLGRLLAVARQAGLARRPEETELALAERLAEARPWAARAAREAAALIARGRFGRIPLDEGEAAHARALLAEVARRRPPARVPVPVPAAAD